VTGKKKPERVDGARMPVAEIQLAMSVKDTLKSTVGIYDAGVGAQSNETSGRAILARKSESDTGSFEYIDNLAISIAHVGRILVDLIPKIYDGGRVLRILNADNSGTWFKVNEMQKAEDYSAGNKKYVVVNDITIGKYDVRVKAGPGYQTQRVEAVDSMMQFIQAMPETAQVFADVIADNMDWPGSTMIAERLKKIIPPNLLSKEERAELELEENQPPPSPDQVLKTKEEEAKTAGKQTDLQIEQAKNEGKAIDLEKLKAEAMSIDPETVIKLVEKAVKQINAVDKSGESK